ncbi:MAG: protease inhibitor I42 family protein [Eubacteriales bacterium]
MITTFFIKVIAFLVSIVMSISAWLCPVPAKSVTVAFESNPSTGYSWVCEMAPKGIAKISHEFYTQPVSLTPIVGAPGTYTYVIVPVTDGKTKLTFYYMRVWEGKDKAAQIANYDITVTKGILTMEKQVNG